MCQKDAVRTTPRWQSTCHTPPDRWRFNTQVALSTCHTSSASTVGVFRRITGLPLRLRASYLFFFSFPLFSLRGGPRGRCHGCRLQVVHSPALLEAASAPPAGCRPWPVNGQSVRLRSGSLPSCDGCCGCEAPPICGLPRAPDVGGAGSTGAQSGVRPRGALGGRDACNLWKMGFERLGGRPVCRTLNAESCNYLIILCTRVWLGLIKKKLGDPGPSQPSALPRTLSRAHKMTVTTLLPDR